MKYIEWHERYSVGNSDLDADHQSVISIINNLYAAIQAHTGQAEVKGILDRLLDYTQSHFRREEHYMEKVSYPDLAEHKVPHRRMVQKTHELLERYSHNEESIPLETMTFLKDWWVNHIVMMDMQYKPYFEDVEKPSPR